MFKKKMLLIGAALAVVAFAAPAAASASTWTVGGNAVTSTTTVEGHGQIEVTALGGDLHLGPCTVNLHGYLDAGGAGSVNEFTITPGCHATLTSPEITCEIVAAFASTEPSWSISTSGSSVSIGGANFTDAFNEGCLLGPGAAASGTATATFNNETSNVVLSHSGDLETPEGEEVFLTGSVHLVAEGGAVELDP